MIFKIFKKNYNNFPYNLCTEILYHKGSLQFIFNWYIYIWEQLKFIQWHTNKWLCWSGGKSLTRVSRVLLNWAASLPALSISYWSQDQVLKGRPKITDCNGKSPRNNSEKYMPRQAPCLIVWEQAPTGHGSDSSSSKWILSGLAYVLFSSLLIPPWSPPRSASQGPP